LKQASLAGRTITLKLKTADFRSRTRSHRLAEATQLAEALFRTAAALLAGEADGIPGFGRSRSGRTLSSKISRPTSRPCSTRELDRPRRIEHAMNQIRPRLGDEAARPVALPRGAIAAQQRELTGSSRESGQQFGLTSGSISSSLARIE
jgi:DNA polymerase IV